jgi:16S rRNA (cytosine967-C5)-methyltransferase
MGARPSVERRRALEILRDVRNGTRADESFERRTAGLDDRQRAFTMELAYGAIRWRDRLDYHLDALLKRGIDTLPPDVVSILELGAYQIVFLDRVPVWSAVDESVELVNHALPNGGASWASGLVNAVLRNVDRQRQKLPLPDPDDRVLHLAIKHSHPKWMVARWVEAYGAETAEALLESNNRPPNLHLAVNVQRATTGTVLERLIEGGIEARPHPDKPDALVVGRGTPPAALPGWVDGWFWIQDAGSQWVTDMVDAGPQDRVLDACAAPGTKLCGLLAKAPALRALAIDIDVARLRRVRENVHRLGVTEPWLVAADARSVPTEAQFSLVIADVPCSGTGVLRRRVDARWRRSPEDVKTFAAFQRGLLAQLADRVAPGGTLVYATCSLEPEENDRVVTAFLSDRQEFRSVPVGGAVPGHHRDGDYMMTRPWSGDLDGFFAARLVREAA